DVPRDTGVDVPRDTGVDVPRDTGVDVPRDTGVDTGPTCPAGLTYCGSDCVDLTSSESNCGACANACAGGTNGVPACTARVCGLQCFAGYDDCDGNRANGCETVLLSTAAHCGACGRACTAPTGGDASCMMGSCRMSCPAGRTLCGSACVDTRADASHCGVCGSACAAGRSCVNGACTVPETPFRVVALPVAECRLNEHSALSGSSQGGLAYTREQLIHAGSTGTAVFDPNLLRGTLGPTRYPALIGTTTGQAYTLAAGSAPLGATGGVADGIIAVNPDGALSPTRVALSTPITITTGTGFFSGYNRVMVHAGGRVWDIDVTTGQVSNRGAVTLPPHPTCGGLGFWGVAENYVGQHYLVFIQNRTTIARVRVSDGQVTPLATFTDLGSSCAFTVGQGQWFIATDGPSDFAPAANVGASHVVGCTANTDQPIVVGGASLAAGGGFSCALRPNGGVACWGVNADGQVGDNNAASPRLAPSAVVAMPTAVSVVAGARHACALQSAGRVYCWGDNASGQLGSNTVTGRRFAALVGGLSDAVEIAAGDAHTCARRSNGAVMCWGANAQGQIGDGSTINRLAPVAVADVTDAIGITAGAAHTCVLRRNLTALCWGANAQGQIGDGSAINRPGATPVTGLFELRSLAAGGEFTCARGGENALCWGANASGQLGDGSRTGRLVPREIDLPASGQIAAGGSHACAVTRTRTAGCWGNGASGRLGNGDTLDRVNPTDVRGLANVTEITLGEDHTCARVEGGAVLCWGANLTGQLGDGTSASRLTPVAVTGL
ncbi:MAG: hypothetical protein Q8S73_15360, partial [Deltaproteobacteria bacterium]|nr:hypothetical protein [Deltaproteobacteria bacterium]